jgi:hypothetical protein
MLRPTYTLTLGSVRSSTDNPGTGLDSLVIDRDMDVPADALRLRLKDRSGIAVGDEVALDLGYDGEEEPMFTGTVEIVQPSITGAVVRALGTMNGLLNLRTSAVFANQSAGSIARDLIGQAGLSAGTIDEGPELPRYVVDRALSAYRHLKDLADRLGYELYADRDGNVMFHALGPGAGLDLPGALAVAAGLARVESGEGYVYGRQLLGAAAGERGVSLGTVEVGGESPMSRQGDNTEYWLTTNDADYRGSAGSGEPLLLVRDPAARTRDLADRFAAGRLAVASRLAREISVTVLGRPGVDLGVTVSVEDVPDATINGGGYVRAVSHRFGEGKGFLTDLRISMEPGS